MSEVRPILVTAILLNISKKVGVGVLEKKKITTEIKVASSWVTDT